MKLTGSIFALLVIGISGSAWAAFEELEIGVPVQAMGGVGVLLEGPWAVLYNPAAIAGSETMSVSAGGRLPFTVMDMATFGLDGVMPLSGRWTAGASLRYFGGELYNEQMLALTFAGKLTEDMSFGVQPVLGNVAISDGVSEYGSAVAYGVNAGFRVTMYDRWMLAASVRNPFQARIGESDDHMESRVDIGFGFRPLTGMVSALSFSRDFRGTRIHVGQSMPLGPLTLRAGVQSEPVTVSAGFGAELGGVGFDYAVVTHPQLDLTHQAGVSYAF